MLPNSHHIIAALIVRHVTTSSPARHEYIIDDNHDYRVIQSTLEDVTGCTLSSAPILLESETSICYKCGSIIQHTTPMYAPYIPWCPSCMSPHELINYYLHNKRICWPELLTHLPLDLQEKIYVQVCNHLLTL